MKTFGSWLTQHEAFILIVIDEVLLLPFTCLLMVQADTDVTKLYEK